jgi:hypothetical protein
MRSLAEDDFSRPQVGINLYSAMFEFPKKQVSDFHGHSERLAQFPI